MKTLVFIFSASDCFKNFVAVPDSVFDQLGVPLSEKRIKLVFVVPEERRDEFKRLQEYAGRFGDNAVIEYVRVQPRHTFRGAARAFIFFYSYLVYTGTTAVLATMGMRLTDAPGGGNRWLAPLKWFISRTLGWSDTLRRKIVPFFYAYFFPERAFQKLFERVKPDLVFIPNLFDRFDQEASREAEYQKIPRLGMTLNWDHYDKYFLPFPVEQLLVQSEQVKDFAHMYQHYPVERMHTVGYPFLDFLAHPTLMRSRDEVLKGLGFPANAKYIMYIAGSMYCPDEPDVIEEMLRWADKGELGADVYFVIRPYPRSGARGKDIAFDQDKFEAFAKHPRVSVQIQKFLTGMETDAEFVNIMRHADAVMAIYSTAVLPAAALDRPLLTLGFDGYHERPFRESVNRFAMREHFKDVLDTGGQVRAVSFPDLKEKLVTYLAHPETDTMKRAALKKRVVGPSDGKASERIYTEIMKLLA